MIIFGHKPWIKKVDDNFLRQVGGIKYLIQMSTYESGCGEREIAWVERVFYTNQAYGEDFQVLPS